MTHLVKDTLLLVASVEKELGWNIFLLVKPQTGNSSNQKERGRSGLVAILDIFILAPSSQFPYNPSPPEADRLTSPYFKGRDSKIKKL
jgi:hypothetical protein